MDIISVKINKINDTINRLIKNIIDLTSLKVLVT